jgi:PAS domain S-box-containing protein
MNETTNPDINRFAQLIIENAGDVMWYLDLATTKFMFVSPSVFKLTGYVPEEILQKSLQEVLTQESYHMFITELPKRVDSFESGDHSVRLQTHEIDLICKNGAIVPTEVITTLIPDDHGKVTGIFGVSRDITEHKLASEVQEQFRLAFVTNPDAITITDTENGTFIKVNDGFCQLTGYQVDEVIGKSSRELQLWYNAKERNHFVEELGKKGVVKNMQVKMRNKDGSINTVLFSGTTIVLNGKKHMLAIARGIEDLVRTKEELVKAKEKAQESDRLKTVFLQNMSHEIRTPMNAIIGFANLMPEYFEDKEKLLEFTQIINQRGSDLLEIINEILEFSKIEAGQLPVHLEPCNLSDIFEEIKDFFSNYCKKINKEYIDFVVNPCWRPKLFIITDRVKLKQIFINLIYNAFKFTQEGRIEMGCNLNKEGLIQFYVSDTGPGIPEDKQAVIFERFMQVDGTSYRQGFGLGLAIVKGLVELLGGTISLESKVNEGSKFLFSIQYAAASRENETPEVFDGEDLPDFSSLTVLVVEDDEYSVKYINEILKRKVIHLHYVNTGKKAVDFALSNHVDIILMDIRLPEMQGYEAARIIKEKKPEIKIIAQTAYASTEDQLKALDSGCDDYISKPINQKLLFAKICNILREKEKN